jgi:protein-tyrosine phosphatase
MIAPLLKSLLEQLAPRSLLAAIHDYREIAADKRSIFVRLWTSRMLGLRRDCPKVTSASRHFLFICFGNIMRSPMAAALLEERVARRNLTAIVRSAGTNATEGRQAEPRAVAAAPAHGVSLEHHRASPVTEEAMRWADVVFAMDYRNEVELVHRFPWAEEKIVLLGAFGLGRDLDVPIPDPYTEDEATLIDCYARLVVAVDAVAQQLAWEAEGR